MLTITRKSGQIICIKSGNDLIQIKVQLKPTPKNKKPQISVSIDADKKYQIWREDDFRPPNTNISQQQ